MVARLTVLLFYKSRAASAVVLSPQVRLWSLERSAADGILGPLRRLLCCALLKQVPLLRDLSHAQFSELATRMESRAFAPGQRIFDQGDPGDDFFVVEEGVVEIWREGSDVRTQFARGQFFGELALLRRDVRSASAAAATACRLFVCARDAFDALLGDLPALQRDWRLGALCQAPVLARLPVAVLERLSQSLRVRHAEPGACVMRRGERAEALWLLEWGQCLAVRGEGADDARGPPLLERATVLRRGALLDARAALRGETHEESVWTDPAGGPATFLCCDAAALRSVLESQGVEGLCRLEQIFADAHGRPPTRSQREDEGHAQQGQQGHGGEAKKPGSRSRAEVVPSPKHATIAEHVPSDLIGALRLSPAPAPLEGPPPTLHELERLECLGSGAFASVYLVRARGRFFALKVMSKAHVVAAGMQKHVVRERSVMAELSSPFVTALHASYQDESALYLLMELVQGGDFFTHLQVSSGI